MSIKKSTIYKSNIHHDNYIDHKCTDMYDHLFSKYGAINFTSPANKNIQRVNRTEKDLWKSLNQIYDMDFVDDLFIKYYELCDVLLIITINNITINITFENELFEQKQIDMYVFHIINIIRMFDVNLNFDKTFNFILSPFLKTLSYESLKQYFKKYPFTQQVYSEKNESALSPFHINTGVSINHKIIYLYRIDELFKVLFHECIHNFKIDVNDHNMTCEKGVESSFNFCKHMYIGENEYPLLINEAYTEYLAILMWNYYLCQLDVYHHKNPNNIKSISALYAHLICRETENSALQCAKVFKYYNMSNLTMLLNKNALEQNTNAFSYTFIKHILLTNVIDVDQPIKIMSNLLDETFTVDGIKKYEYILNINEGLDDMFLQLSAYKLLI